MSETTSVLFAQVELGDNLRRRIGRAHPQAGRNGFGKAHELDHPVCLVEGFDGRLRLPCIAQGGIGVVLQNNDAIFLRQSCKLFSALCRQRAPGGVLEGWDGVDEFGLILHNLLFQLFHDEPMLIHLGLDEIRLIHFKRLDGAQERRRFDDNAVSGVDERFCQQIDALGRAGKDDKLLFFRGKPLGLEQLLHLAQQIRRAQRAAILQNAVALLPDQFLRIPCELIRREGFGGRIPAGKGDDLRIAQQGEDRPNGASFYSIKPLCKQILHVYRLAF